VTTLSGDRLALHLDRFVAVRTEASERFFTDEADRIARLCHLMAERFARGGRLLALGALPQARSDARHVAVEFVHPVIVGKRALPALALVPDGGSLLDQLELVARAEDMAIGFGLEGLDGASRASLLAAREKGLLTISFSPGAEWEFLLPTSDPFVGQELAETLYHVLWELIHVFFEQRGLLNGREQRATHDAGGSSFLYPFLAEQEADLASVVADVGRSVLIKARETSELRASTIAGARSELTAAAIALHEAFESGGALFAFGNGGSATDAMDCVADFRAAPQGWGARRCFDLTEDTAILTALANDIGSDALFARQLIAHARPGDVALALSTSGGSRNIVEALAEARRRGLRTIAFLGYDGGAVAAGGLADHVVVVPSEHIPRIQEAHASSLHALRELVELLQPEGSQG